MSSIDKLRNAAKYLKVSSSGSKQKIYTRIREAHLTALKMQSLEGARQEYEALDPKPRFENAPKQPSAMERKLHEVTHLPFRPWCAFCVQAKSRGHYKHKSTPEELAERTHPTVQVDLFAMPNCMGVLLMVDVWTKYISVEPLRNKNAGVIGAILARFLSNLSYFDVVEISYDNEPVLSAGVKMTQVIRANQGLPTVLQPGKMYSKARTRLAERSIQIVRAEGKCLVAFLEDKMQMKIPDDHVLRAWAMVHGSWLLNRYHLTSSNGVTAYMAVRGRPYKGRVCAFGEEVYALDSFNRSISVSGDVDVGLPKMKPTMTLFQLDRAKFYVQRQCERLLNTGMEVFWLAWKLVLGISNVEFKRWCNKLDLQGNLYLDYMFLQMVLKLRVTQMNVQF